MIKGEKRGILPAGNPWDKNIQQNGKKDKKRHGRSAKGKIGAEVSTDSTDSWGNLEWSLSGDFKGLPSLPAEVGAGTRASDMTVTFWQGSCRAGPAEGGLVPKARLRLE